MFRGYKKILTEHEACHEISRCETKIVFDRIIVGYMKGYYPECGFIEFEGFIFRDLIKLLCHDLRIVVLSDNNRWKTYLINKEGYDIIGEEQ